MITPLLAAAALSTLLTYAGQAWAVQASAAALSLAAGWSAARGIARQMPLAGAGWLAVCAAAAMQLIVGHGVIGPRIVGEGIMGEELNGWTGMEKLQHWVGFGLIFVAGFSAFRRDSARQQLILTLAAFGGVLAVWAILQPYGARFGLHQLAAASEEMAGPFQSRNTFAAFVELAFPAAVWAARRVGPEWWLPAGLLLASAVMTGSRAGAALVLIEAILLAAWFRQGVAVMVLSVACAAGLMWGNGVLATRIGYQDPLEHRREIYVSSLELIRNRPISGWGLGAFEQAYPAQARFDVGLRVNHAHSDWLELAVETGIPLASVAAAMFAVILWRARFSIWALGLGAVAIHSLVDFPFQRIGVTAWFALVAAASAAHGRERLRARSSPEVQPRVLADELRW